METLLPNVNTSEGCFEIGVTISNPVFTEDAINKRKHERELLNKICILSMLARLRPIQKVRCTGNSGHYHLFFF
ncbi:cell division inhibition protein DicB [Escherichia coli]